MGGSGPHRLHNTGQETMDRRQEIGTLSKIVMGENFLKYTYV